MCRADAENMMRKRLNELKQKDQNYWELLWGKKRDKSKLFLCLVTETSL